MRLLECIALSMLLLLLDFVPLKRLLTVLAVTSRVRNANKSSTVVLNMLSGSSSAATLRKDGRRDGNSADGGMSCRSVVICGPSGVGKGTIIQRLLQQHPLKLGLSVSHTSRLPRPGEVNGVHYHFVAREQLLNDINTGPIRYIEHAEVHSNLYGTRQDDVDAVHQQGKLCLLDLDSRGVKQIIDNHFPAKLVFIAPPSVVALEQRLRSRDTESEEQIQLRLKNALKEIEFGTQQYRNSFDLILYNEHLEETIDQFNEYLCEWFPDVITCLQDNS